MKTLKTSIRKKVERPLMILMAEAILLLGILGIFLNFLGTRNTLKATLPKTADFASQAVTNEVTAARQVIEVVGSIALLGNSEISYDEKKEILDGLQEKNNWITYCLRDAQGNDMSPEKREYDSGNHIQAMTGETVIGDPVYDEALGKFVVVICVPLWKDGVRDTTAVGTLTAVMDGTVLSDMMTELAVSKRSYAYMLDSKGNLIAHTDDNVVLTRENKIEAAKAGNKWSKEALHQQNMINGQSGFGQYYSETNQSRLIAYAPVDINSWSIAISVPYTDFLSEVFFSMAVTLIIMVVMMIVAIAVAKKVGTQITHPIELCAERLQLLAQGDLNAPLPEINTDDETRWLAESTGLIVNQMKMIIFDIEFLLEEMSNGNFVIKTKIGDDAYVGNFKQIIVAMRTLKLRLMDTIREINEGSRQVEAGAVQMAESSQNLAQGATDQTGSIEELLANITDVATHVENNNQATDKVYTQAVKVVEEARISQRKMEELSLAMERIEESSRQIGNIIENIEEIASETNMLSLNAAIEAARAGEAGRGFSVVADQIRKLAEQSAESAVDTRELIGTSIKVVNSGGEITKDTAAYLNKVIDGIQEIMDAMKGVRESSNKQTTVINDIEQSVQEISQVVESNSASAEEGSATSEELSAQAESLGNLISKFRFE